MKRKLFGMLLVIAIAMIPLSAYAAEAETASEIVANTNKPYLALGADLTADQRAVVLAEMGITEEQLSDYTVVYITNEQEHAALDSYIESSVIGTKSLSCAMVKENTDGKGIRVTTKNINYCTISMYRNALVTAGVENADVMVVGPTQISGTAALLGIMSAYEEMSGVTLSEDAKETALEELVTVGEVLDTSDEDGEVLQDLIEYVKAEVVAGDLTDVSAIEDVITNGETEFGITLTDEQKDMLSDVMQKIGDIDIDTEKLMEQAGDLYEQY